MSLHHLVLLFHQHPLLILVVQQLLVQHPNEGVLVRENVPPDLVFGVAQLLDNCLDDFLIELLFRRPVVLEVILEEFLAVFKPVVNFGRLRS